jgi:hypothetical protein
MKFRLSIDDKLNAQQAVTCEIAMHNGSIQFAIVPAQNNLHCTRTTQSSHW